MKLAISIILGVAIGILPTALWGFTVQMWQWWAIIIPANLLVQLALINME